jgi:hypothetical protein
MHGQELDEETQPILWIEWPTIALVDASSFWADHGSQNYNKKKHFFTFVVTKMPW